MKEVSLSGSLRTNVGKKDAKAVRNEGRVPCVVYGSGKQTHFSVKHMDLYKIMFSPNVYSVNINIDGTKVKTIIQDSQQHPVTDKILHVDFLELQDDKMVKIDIPVTVSGRSIGVMNGGRLQQVFRKLTVLGYPKDIPETINVDITKLRIGQSIRVKALETGELKILNAPNAVVVSIKMSRGAIDLEEEEAAAAPEAAAEEAAE
ncbi:50S ribosomal protein L25 [Putridiphycobacter roseus]|uniref:Large ribosomal subunit protein bL25 n=1 Tax=Putridiphycobacter roseus TaxID=2219161 RepID=A0A2W1NB48_9FLAO|nr:50S ribosomal protein L25/general stress protein Ctc [Putridiphycobacter roseus]PZE16283.1 50S ribosomal protein L25 [Putridiphycobacter roseus]